MSVDRKVPLNCGGNRDPESADMDFKIQILLGGRILSLTALVFTNFHSLHQMSASTTFRIQGQRPTFLTTISSYIIHSWASHSRLKLVPQFFPANLLSTFLHAQWPIGLISSTLWLILSFVFVLFNRSSFWFLSTSYQQHYCSLSTAVHVEYG